ncbi:MAG: Flp pilus assembly protein CpaB, partial [Rhodoblastus sp.]|nr:Flp pilus assembly protein CpaB [Rhodoblastus sp.]
MIGIAGVFGAISIFAADMWLKSAAQARVEPVIVAAAPVEPQVAFRTIVVAKEPLRFGAELTEAQLTEIPWAQDALPEGASEKVAALLSAGGRVVLSPIEANEPVLLAKLSGPNGRAT